MTIGNFIFAPGAADNDTIIEVVDMEDIDLFKDV